MKFFRFPTWMASVLFLVLLQASVLHGQSTWNGSQSSVWSLAGNWTGSVPTAGTNVIIPSGTPNSPSTSGVATAACNSLTVNSGATLTVASGFNLAVSADLTIDGTVAGTGTVR